MPRAEASRSAGLSRRIVAGYRYELLESVVLCNKVGLRVDLDHCGGVFVIGKKDIDNTFGCDTVSLLCSYGKSLLTKNLYSLVEISARLGESLLALPSCRSRSWRGDPDTILQ